VGKFIEIVEKFPECDRNWPSALLELLVEDSYNNFLCYLITPGELPVVGEEPFDGNSNAVPSVTGIGLQINLKIILRIL